MLYIKAEQSVEVTNTKVLLEDVVKLYSVDKKMVNSLNREVVTTIKAKENTKYTISILKLIEIISKRYPEVTVINLGEQDIVLSYIIPGKQKKMLEYLKTAFVAVSIFFGAAFTIMTFNADANVSEVFQGIYTLILGHAQTSNGSILEIAYSIGLPIGIIIFFNHFSRNKIHNDPTPIQIQMRLYEGDFNKTLIQDSSREGKTIDAD